MAHSDMQACICTEGFSHEEGKLQHFKSYPSSSPLMLHCVPTHLNSSPCQLIPCQEWPAFLWCYSGAFNLGMYDLLILSTITTISSNCSFEDAVLHSQSCQPHGPCTSSRWTAESHNVAWSCLPHSRCIDRSARETEATRASETEGNDVARASLPCATGQSLSFTTTSNEATKYRGKQAKGDDVAWTCVVRASKHPEHVACTEKSTGSRW